MRTKFMRKVHYVYPQGKKISLEVSRSFHRYFKVIPQIFQEAFCKLNSIKFLQQIHFFYSTCSNLLNDTDMKVLHT